jgi:hypothetical protein
VSRRWRKYRQVLSTNDKGNIAEAAITLEAMKLGIEVLKPVAEHCRYDWLSTLGTGSGESSANGRAWRVPLSASTWSVTG